MLGRHCIQCLMFFLCGKTLQEKCPHCGHQH